MTIDAAAALLRTPRIQWAQSQIWCDLGCGEGLFTLALATLLPTGSIIYAVDRSQSALNSIPGEHAGISIRKICCDFNGGNLPLSTLDGILIANTLHFIPEQENLLKRLEMISKRFLVVEYERLQSSRW